LIFSQHLSCSLVTLQFWSDIFSVVVAAGRLQEVLRWGKESESNIQEKLKLFVRNWDACSSVYCGWDWFWIWFTHHLIVGFILVSWNFAGIYAQFYPRLRV
jgi:hypothetical protein